MLPCRPLDKSIVTSDYKVYSDYVWTKTMSGHSEAWPDTHRQSDETCDFLVSSEPCYIQSLELQTQNVTTGNKVMHG